MGNKMLQVKDEIKARMRQWEKYLLRCLQVDMSC